MNPNFAVLKKLAAKNSATKQDAIIKNKRIYMDNYGVCVSYPINITGDCQCDMEILARMKWDSGNFNEERLILNLKSATITIQAKEIEEFPYEYDFSNCIGSIKYVSKVKELLSFISTDDLYESLNHVCIGNQFAKATNSKIAHWQYKPECTFDDIMLSKFVLTLLDEEQYLVFESKDKQYIKLSGNYQEVIINSKELKFPPLQIHVPKTYNVKASVNTKALKDRLTEAKGCLNKHTGSVELTFSQNKLHIYGENTDDNTSYGCSLQAVWNYPVILKFSVSVNIMIPLLNVLEGTTTFYIDKSNWIVVVNQNSMLSLEYKNDSVLEENEYITGNVFIWQGEIPSEIFDHDMIFIQNYNFDTNDDTETQATTKTDAIEKEISVKENVPQDVFKEKSFIVDDDGLPF